MPPKKNPPKKNADKRVNPRKKARADVNLALMPQRQLLSRQRNQAIRDTNARGNQLQALYGGLNDTLKGLSGPLDNQLQGISGDLTDQLKALTGQLGTAGPGGELAAAAGLFGNIGAGALGQLASDRARNVTYNTSAIRQGAEEGLVAGRNNRQDLLNELADIRQQQAQVGSMFGPQFLSHLDDVRDQRFQEGLALKEFGLRKDQLAQQAEQNDALVQFLQDQISGGLGGGFGGGGGGGFPGPGNGNGGVAGSPGHPGPQGHPNPGSGGDNPGGGGSGSMTPMGAFTSGERGWRKISAPNRADIRENINDFWINHREEPAFASLAHYASQHPNHPSLPASMHTPQALIDLIRQFYYGAHHPGSPGGKPLP